MDNIKLMIVEDDPVWMKCISDFVSKDNDITVVKKVYMKEEALKVTDLNNIDVVLLDLTLGDNEEFGGFEVASHLNKNGLKKIIMLTSWDETEIITEAFDRGAVNYVTKSSYRDIPNAIREAYTGRISLHPDVSSKLICELKLERKARSLSPAEREVFILKEKGLTKLEIAKKLFKSIDTIKNQLKNINKKIQ